MLTDEIMETITCSKPQALRGLSGWGDRFKGFQAGEVEKLDAERNKFGK
jgi:hypothetical protein